jgi:hypothetical protein
MPAAKLPLTVTSASIARANFRRAHPLRAFRIARSRAGRGNEIVRDAVRCHAPLFHGMAMLAMDATTPDDIRRLHDEGFTGLKIIHPRRAYDHPVYWPVYEAAQSLRMPILIHTGVQSGVIDFLEPDLPPASDPVWALNAQLEASQVGAGLSSMKMHQGLLDTLGFTFPELRTIGAHLGYGWYDIACALAAQCVLRHLRGHGRAAAHRRAATDRARGAAGQARVRLGISSPPWRAFARTAWSAGLRRLRVPAMPLRLSFRRQLTFPPLGGTIRSVGIPQRDGAARCTRPHEHCSPPRAPH